MAALRGPNIPVTPSEPPSDVCSPFATVPWELGVKAASNYINTYHWAHPPTRSPLPRRHWDLRLMGKETGIYMNVGPNREEQEHLLVSSDMGPV